MRGERGIFSGIDNMIVSCFGNSDEKVWKSGNIVFLNILVKWKKKLFDV